MEGNVKENTKEGGERVIAISILCGVVLVAILFLYFSGKNKAEEPENFREASEKTDALIPPSANPLDFVTPEATPLEKTNPFKYENPFE